MNRIVKTLRHAWTFAAAGLALLLVSCVSPSPDLAGQSPSAVTRGFYQSYLKLGMSGLPDKAQSRQISPYLGADLRKAIAEAQKTQDLAIKHAPDEKPPWSEGDLFSSLFEGAQQFEVRSEMIKGPRAEVQVQLRNTEGTPPTRWTDVAVLQKEGDTWVITDIQFKGSWAFKSGASLSSVLKAR
jgi:hypothetical protein